MEVEEGSDQKVALLLHLINVHVYSKESFLPFENCADLMKLDNFVTFGRPLSGKVIIQEMTEFVVSIN